MNITRQQVLETVDYLRPAIADTPRIGILTGTGLADSLDEMTVYHGFDYSELPHFPAPTVESHTGRLILGALGTSPLVVLQGRFHLYEGYSPAQVSFPVRLLQELGVDHLILLNAAGGINPDFSCGEIMIITDHINLTGQNPLVGPNTEEWGIRFPDMTKVYDPELMEIAWKKAGENGIPVQKGVYAGLLGPSLETPSEIRFLRTIGSDAVGLSTVMEAIAAVHAGMKILGLSLISNINDPDHPCQTTLEAVLLTARKAAGPMNRLLCDIIRAVSKDGLTVQHLPERMG